MTLIALNQDRRELVECVERLCDGEGIQGTIGSVSCEAGGVSPAYVTLCRRTEACSLPRRRCDRRRYSRPCTLSKKKRGMVHVKLLSSHGMLMLMLARQLSSVVV